MWLFIGIFIVFVILCLMEGPTDLSHRTDGGLEASMNWHRQYGTHRVVYTDTFTPSGNFAVSQPMSLDVAMSYARMFGGCVIGRNDAPPRPPKGAAEAALKAKGHF